ncbi:MAG TPA: ornithine cyclodeaminase family protein [Gaiellaceae bacterium]|nr:ornithine cyclodeaminase family protein [Gaiellaceae bacterium]
MIETLLLDQETVTRLLRPRDLLDALTDGFRSLSAGEVVAPTRLELTVEKGFCLSMPAWRPGGRFAVKLVNVFEGNGELGLPSHQAVINVFDSETGTCEAVLDGTAITALRTAGAAAVSVELLARPDAKVMTIIGAGVQGRAHLELVPHVREVEEIHVGSLRLEDAERLAQADPRASAVSNWQEAVETSDIVCLCTHGGQAVIDAGWVADGAHVTSVGYKEPAGELPRELLDRGSLFLETRLAFEPPPTGCFELEGLDPAQGTELGEVLAGDQPGRSSDGEITVYKAMGHAIEDLVVAELVLDAARREGAGQQVRL